MPGMDGLEAARRIRAAEADSRRRAHADRRAHRQCLAGGPRRLPRRRHGRLPGQAARSRAACARLDRRAVRARALCGLKLATVPHIVINPCRAPWCMDRRTAASIRATGIAESDGIRADECDATTCDPRQLAARPVRAACAAAARRRARPAFRRCRPMAACRPAPRARTGRRRALGRHRRARGAARAHRRGSAPGAEAALPRVLRGEVRRSPNPARLLARRDVDAYRRDLRSPAGGRSRRAATRPRKPPAVVGTYRLLRQDVAERHGGFYTAGEFDIGALIGAPPRAALPRARPLLRAAALSQQAHGRAAVARHLDLCAAAPARRDDRLRQPRRHRSRRGSRCRCRSCITTRARRSSGAPRALPRPLRRDEPACRRRRSTRRRRCARCRR